MSVVLPEPTTLVESPVEKPQHVPERIRRQGMGLNWPVVFWLALLHVGALAAPWTFTWAGLGMAVFLHWMTGSLGICMGFHRLFTHRSFVTTTPVRFFLGLCGSLAGEGGALYWVANHRQHHAESDQDDDPHSPEHGGWWSHVFWTCYGLKGKHYHNYIRRWAPDVAKDPVMQFLDRTFIFWNLACAAGAYGVGYALGGATLGWSLLVWGVCLRMVALLHATWFVNSATHIWGYRTYETSDNSRNNWWVALLTYGEGWHNNHHAFPRMARAGHKWWEVDITFLTIRLMERVGLVWNVCDGQHEDDDADVEAHRAA